jgi:hypothetical protein
MASHIFRPEGIVREYVEISEKIYMAPFGVPSDLPLGRPPGGRGVLPSGLCSASRGPIKRISLPQAQSALNNLSRGRVETTTAAEAQPSTEIAP